MHYSENYIRFLAKLGYYDYQQGLIERNLNQGEGWNSHLQNCRNYILRAVRLMKPDKITILGSGWLLDLPLAELSEMKVPMTLIDIIHPPDVLKQLEGFKDITIVHDDITGGLIHEIWVKTGSIPVFNRLKTISDIKIPRYRYQSDPGMVISLNILSQLDTLPVRYLKKKSAVKDDEFLEFRAEIQRKHIEMLQKHPSVLITDVEEIFHERGGRKISGKTVLTDIADGKDAEEWIWDFDLKSTDYRRKQSQLKVLATMFPG